MNPLSQAAKGKRVADSMEALLGVTFLSSGGAAALNLGSVTSTPERQQQQQWDPAPFTRGLASTAVLSEAIGVMPAGSSRDLQLLLAPSPQNVRSHTRPASSAGAPAGWLDTAAARLAPVLGGYTFRDLAHLQEALTHCSFPVPPCNQARATTLGAVMCVPVLLVMDLLQVAVACQLKLGNTW